MSNHHAKKLMVQPPPITGENLPGYVIRLAALNAYPGAHDVLAQAGIETVHPESIGSLSRERLSGLVGLLGEGIVPMIHTRSKGGAGLRDFFGMPLRNVHREVLRRRVAPRALAASPHMRAVWALRPFCFDPETRERLIDACPVCAQPLGYKRTLGGIAFCESCTRTDEEGFTRAAVDLRDFPQPRIEVEDDEALSLVTALADPDPRTRDAFSDRIAEPFRVFHRGQLFELAIAFACAVTADADRSMTTLDRPANREEYARLSPEALAMAGRALLDWPSGFSALAARVRDGAGDRRGNFGIRKELGPLVGVTVDQHLPRALKKIVREAVDADMAQTAWLMPTGRRRENRHRDDLISAQEASTRFGIHRRLFQRLAADPRVTSFRSTGKKAPTLFVASEIEALARRRDEVDAAGTLVARLGIPREGLAQLAACGLIEAETGPVLHLLVGSSYFDRASVDRFVARVEAQVKPGSPPPSYARLSKSINRIGVVGEKRWDLVFQAVVSGELPVWNVEGDLTTIGARLAAAEIGPIKRILERGQGVISTASEDRLTRREAAGLLGTSEAAVIGLVQEGLLPDDIRRRDVAGFTETYMLTAEIGRVLRERGVRLRHRDVRPWMEARGAAVHAVIGMTGGLVWMRGEVSLALRKM